MTLTILDMNMLANLIMVCASLYIFLAWRKLNFSMARSFLFYGIFTVFSAVIYFYRVEGDLNFFIRGLLMLFRTFFLVYGIGEMIKGAKPLFYSYLLYLLLLPAFLIDTSLENIVLAESLISTVIMTAFFAFLFVMKDSEMRVISFIGLFSATLSGLLFVLFVRTGDAQAFYAPNLLLALMLLGFAHVSKHAPDHIYIAHRKRKRR